MTPYKGLVKHDPENGQWGDCLRTAIGCLLDLPPEVVPHFARKGSAETDAIVAERVERWLARRGLCRITLYLPGTYTPEEACRNLGLMNPGVPYLFSGRSRIGSNHTVIARDGKIIHDPSPLDTGIVGPMDNDFYMVEFLGAKLTGDRAPAINGSQSAA